MYKHILAPTDGSELATAGVKSAIGLARATGARVTFVSCSVPFDVYVLDPLAMNHREQYDTAARNAAHEVLGAAVALARAAGVECDTEHLFAVQAWRGILDAASRHQCDAIVMASHGRHGIAGMLIGSETRGVLAHAKVPVLVVR